MSSKNSLTVGTIDWFHPIRCPFRGLVTSQHPMSLGDGMFSEADNVRIGDGTISVRGGMTASLGTILNGSTFRGIWTGRFQNANIVVVAVAISSTIRVFKSSDCVTFTEISAAAGQYATTRLADNGEPVQIEVVKDPFTSLQGATKNQDCIVWGQRGTAKCVYGDNFAVGSGQIANVIADITAPTHLLARQIYANSNNVGYFKVYDSGETDYATIAATGAGLTMADTGASEHNRVRVSITSSVTLNSTATVLFTTGAGILVGSQFALLLDTQYQSFLDSVTINVGNNTAGSFTGGVTVWAPSNTYQAPHIIPVDATSKFLAVFELSSNTVGTTFKALRIVWSAPTTSAPASTQTVDIMAINASTDTSLVAENPGLTEWAVAKYNSGSHTESPAVLYGPAIPQYLNPALFGCADFGGTRVPFSPLIKFEYYVQLQNPTAAELLAGFDSYRIYRKRPQDDRLTAVQDVRMATCAAGTWSYVSGSSATYVTQFLTGAEPTVDETYPDAFHVAMPAGAALALCGDRLWCGGKDSTTHALFVSALRSPFRYRKFTKRTNGEILDETSPLTISLGTSVPWRVASRTSLLPGIPYIAIFTDQELFFATGINASDLQRLTRVAPYGTVSPYSVAELNGKFFYLDTSMQVREYRIGTAPQSITRRTVDSLLKPIPAGRRAFVTAAGANERYYLYFSPSGATTNTKGLVWDDDSRGWVTDTPPLPIEGLIEWFDGTNVKKRLIAACLATADMKAYEWDLETQSQDLGTTNISIALTAREFTSPDPMKWLRFGRQGLLCDDITSGTATFVRTYKPDASTRSTTTNIDVSTSQAMKFDVDSTDTTGNGFGYTGAVRLTASMTAAKRIYEWFSEIHEVHRPPDV